MKTVKNYISALGVLLVMAPAGYGQTRSDRTPKLTGGTGRIDNLTQKYRASYVAPIDMSNSGRLDQLIRAGNLYLSLSDAIALALENNIGLEIQRYQFELSDVAIQSALAGPNGQWDPTFNVNQFQFQHSNQPVTQTVTSGLLSTNIQDVYNRGFNVQQGFRTGGTATLGFTSGKTITNNTTQRFSPGLSGGLNLNVTQPLLRGAGIGVNSVNITIARNNRRAADYGFRTQINTQVNTVVQAYWNLVSASLNVGVARQSLELSQRLLEQNKKQIEIGTMAPIDIKQTEVQVANGEQAVITAEAAIETQENTLKNLISRNGLASTSIATVHIIPTSRVEVPQVEPVQPIQDLTDMALRARPELEQTRINLENTQANLRVSKNTLLPQLNLTGVVSQPAQAGSRNPGYTPRVLPDGTTEIITEGGFGNILNQLFYQPRVNYTVGFTFSINLRNRSAQAAYATATFNQRTQELQLQQQMNQIRTDVRNAQVNIKSSRARLEASQKALAAQEAVVDGTQRKFQLGTSTLFEVITQQNTLATSRQNVVTAQVAYANAQLAMDVSTGNLMDKYGIAFEEAKDGTVSRRADPIQDVVNQNAQAAR
jgi:outer membrane protein TolC